MKLSTELKKAWDCLSEEGPVGLARAVRNFGTYHFHDKWQFVYLEFDLDNTIYEVEDTTLTVRRAKTADRDRIKADIFPHLREEDAYDRKYFGLLGADDPQCFLGEADGSIIHYSWVFSDVFDSPMTGVPFDSSRLRKADSYIGPVFTRPDARGMTYLYVLPVILRYLKDQDKRRTLVLVDGRNPAAVKFYTRLGFKVLDPR